MIKPFQQAALTRSSLLAMMARGAAAFGANNQPGIDMVYPFLTSKLDVKNVGFILVQVKNHAGTISSFDHTKIFKGMDPFRCKLLGENDSLNVPIIRILFSLGDKTANLIHQTYNPPGEGATKDASGQPKFTSYDFCCSGIGPQLLRPVDENNLQKKWETLLAKLDKWEGVFSKAKGSAQAARRSQYPAGGTDGGHFNAWFAEVE
jgi:hypothetical protein